MLSTRNPSHSQGQTATKSERMEKIFQAKGTEKQAGVAISNIRQNRLQSKINQKRQRGSLHPYQRNK